MGKLWKTGLSILGVLAFLVLGYLVFMVAALSTLEIKYDALSNGQTIAETDKTMGAFFTAQAIQWDDIPEIYTGHYAQKPGSVARDYRFLGVKALSIVVVYDGEGRSWLSIPIYE